MSTLRKCLKRPETYLFMIVVFFVVLWLDSFRPVEKQFSVPVYVALVRYVYRPMGHRIQAGRVKCRYIPSCSEYSIQAVEKFGIRKGLLLSYKRIRSCTRKVEFDTLDPVPYSN